MVLRRMMGPSLETGAVLDSATVGELLRDRDCVSAMAVTLVCDEKGQSSTQKSRPHTVIADPINDSFRDDPRFKDVVARHRLKRD
jgi:hypothetical protein